MQVRYHTYTHQGQAMTLTPLIVGAYMFSGEYGTTKYHEQTAKCHGGCTDVMSLASVSPSFMSLWLASCG